MRKFVFLIIVLVAPVSVFAEAVTRSTFTLDSNARDGVTVATEAWKNYRMSHYDTYLLKPKKDLTLKEVGSILSELGVALYIADDSQLAERKKSMGKAFRHFELIEKKR